ncbi:hypothetical protein BJ508DRAFT_76400 [Ascobolus immersus RN42]|uniref:Uncharacterized protein n=1 Tax=Ascobolus immersus RN42 TaxID=1160509 RepID=A0A3N4HJG8_ASCIM|nr:hypothetical protein BJ508DRAFT_76400 [Ascobolus immersus RN42]
MATSEGRAQAPLPADIDFFAHNATHSQGLTKQPTNEPPPPYPENSDTLQKHDKTPREPITTHIGLTKPSRFREFYTLTIPLGSKNRDVKKQAPTVERLRVKRHPNDYYMPTAKIIENLVDRITAEYTALVDHINAVTKEYPEGTQLMISHLEGHTNTDDLVDPNLEGTLIVELVPIVPGSEEWGHYQEFFLLAANRRVFDIHGQPDPDNFESRDWIHGPLENDLLGIVKVKSNGECLSKDNNIRDEVLNWWEKTMHVLSEFCRRMSKEFYDEKDVVVNSAYTYIDEKYRSSLKVVELVPVDKAPPYMEVHILPPAVFWDLDRYSCLTFNSEFAQEKNRPASYTAAICLRLTANSTEAAMTGDEINNLIYNHKSPRLSVTLQSLGLSTESCVRTVKEYIKSEVDYWKSDSVYPAKRELMVNWVGVRSRLYCIWAENRRSWTSLRCHFVAVSFEEI